MRRLVAEPEVRPSPGRSGRDHQETCNACNRYVTKQPGGGFKGQLKTLSIRSEIEIIPNREKASEAQPDYRVAASGVEVGAGWVTTTLQKIQTLLTQAQGVSFNASSIDAEFTRLFPGQSGTAATTSAQVAAAQTRMAATLAAFHQTMAMQSQIAENVSADAATLATLSTRSQTSQGALQVAQATNQLLALTAKQQLQIQQMTVAQGRADATAAATRAQASIDAQAATKAFLGSGSAYTPR